MATKSKSFKTSFGLKLVAFFIAALLAFSSAICAVEAINDLFRYGSEILTKPAKSLDMTETSLFASKLNSDVQSIYAGSGLMTWDAYKSTYYSTFDEELSAARTELERFKKECMSEAVAAYRDKMPFPSIPLLKRVTMLRGPVLPPIRQMSTKTSLPIPAPTT